LSIEAVQADGYHQRSEQVDLQSIERLHNKKWQFAIRVTADCSTV
jgi:hypothetical protein